MRDTFKYTRKELKYQDASSFNHGDMVHVGKYLIHVWYKVHNNTPLKGTQALHSEVENLKKRIGSDEPQYKIDVEIGELVKFVFVDKLEYDKELINQLNEGLLSGLDKADKTLNDSVFFDFVKLMTEKISPADARKILVFALDRLEYHIEDDFSEGLWSPSLKVSSDISENIAGFISKDSIE